MKHFRELRSTVKCRREKRPKKLVQEGKDKIIYFDYILKNVYMGPLNEIALKKPTNAAGSH